MHHRVDVVGGHARLRRPCRPPAAPARRAGRPRASPRSPRAAAPTGRCCASAPACPRTPGARCAPAPAGGASTRVPGHADIRRPGATWPSLRGRRSSPRAQATNAAQVVTRQVRWPRALARARRGRASPAQHAGDACQRPRSVSGSRPVRAPPAAVSPRRPRVPTDARPTPARSRGRVGPAPPASAHADAASPIARTGVTSAEESEQINPALVVALAAARTAGEPDRPATASAATASAGDPAIDCAQRAPSRGAGPARHRIAAVGSVTDSRRPCGQVLAGVLVSADAVS